MNSVEQPMLTVEGLAKRFATPGKGSRTLFRGMSFNLSQGERLAVLGRNGQGKSTLIKILGGVSAASEGRVRWTGRPSWPIGFGGGFQGGLTGLDNIKFVARVFDQPVSQTVEAVERFAELGEHLLLPVRYYSSGMAARLAFGLALALDFNCFLIDEVIAVGDAVFRTRCEEALFSPERRNTFVIASHDLAFLKSHCTRAIVIDRGIWKAFDDIDLAVDIYAAICDEDVERSLAAVGRRALQAAA